MSYRQLMLEELGFHREAVAAICTEIRELRFPSAAPGYLVNVIEHLVDSIESSISARARQLGDGADEDYDIRARLATEAIERLAAHLRLAERASSHRVLPGSARTFVRLAGQVLPGSQFVVRPQWSCNYSIDEMILTYSDMLMVAHKEGLVDQDTFNSIIGVVEGHKAGALYILGFPWIEKDRVLFHVALGHELGHPIADRFFRQSLAEPYIAHVIKMIQETSGKSVEASSPLSVEMELADKAHDAEVLCRRALEEVIADLVGLHLFGYSALAYTARMGELHGMDLVSWVPPGRHYPPWRFRLRAMMRAVPDGWIDLFVKQAHFALPEEEKAVRDHWSQLCELANAESDLEGISKVPQLKLAYSAVGLLLLEVSKFVDKELRTVGINLADLPDRLHAEMVDRVLQGYPPDAFTATTADGPVERGAELRGILTAAWVARLFAREGIGENSTGPHEEENADRREARLRKRLRLHERLVEKALEYSDLRSAWARSRGDHEGK